MPRARKKDVERLSGKPFDDYRNLFNRILAMAAEGRLPLTLLQEITRSLADFFDSPAVEMLWGHNGRIVTVTVPGRSRPDTGGRRWADLSHVRLLEASELLPRRLVRRAGMRLAAAGRRAGEANGALLVDAVAGDTAELRYGLLFFSAGPGGAGMTVLALKASARDNATSRTFLNRLAATVGMALSLNQSRFELRERVKELTCMYRIANLAAVGGKSLAPLLQQVVSSLPEAYLYPEITAAHIELEGERYQTDGFGAPAPENCQQADIVVGGRRLGAVTVAYREPRPTLDEGPFLAEERRLLDSVAREVALIVERRQAEVAKGQLARQLQHSERLATIGKLAAGVAHEINEPLTGILGFAELLQETEGMPPQALSDVGRIASAALHAREVVRKLLLFARQVSSRHGRVTVNRVVREVTGFLSNRCIQSGIDLVLDLGESLPEISGDEAQIRQIVLNLAVNAVQAMDGGGVLQVATESDDDGVTLTVRDTGSGIPEGIRDQVFLPFFTTKELDQGTGLGLAVVHGIVESHGGRIDFFPRRAGGTEFRVRLPLAGKAPPATGGP